MCQDVLLITRMALVYTYIFCPSQLSVSSLEGQLLFHFLLFFTFFSSCYTSFQFQVLLQMMKHNSDMPHPHITVSLIIKLNCVNFLLNVSRANNITRNLLKLFSQQHFDSSIINFKKSHIKFNYVSIIHQYVSQHTDCEGMATPNVK